jgi:hypothetical protein
LQSNKEENPELYAKCPELIERLAAERRLGLGILGAALRDLADAKEVSQKETN